MATFRISITVPHTFEYEVEADDTRKAELLARSHFNCKDKPRLDYHRNDNPQVVVKLVGY